MNETRYLVASNREKLTYAGIEYIGRRCTPCDGTGHMLYVLPLAAADVEAFRRARWSRPEGGGRKTITLTSGQEIYVSANPACRWATTTVSVRPRTDKKGSDDDAGPVALEASVIEDLDEDGPIDASLRAAPSPKVAHQVKALTEADQRWIVRRIIDILGAHEPRFERVTKRLLVDLLRRWTSDGVGPNGIDVEALWTSFELLPHTARALEDRERRAFTHEHVVPCRVLRDWLLAEPTRSEDEIHAHIDRFCLAALVHDDEDALLPKSSMPTGWTLTLASDPWARYKAARLADGRSLFEALTFPAGFRVRA